jgi:hypothetical protein
MKLISFRINPAHCLQVLLILAAGAAVPLAEATPYATCLTNDGTGTISFRLNQTTGTNDLVQIISSGGTVTNSLQSPSGNPANVLNRGLIITNLGVAPGVFQVHIKHVGSGIISTNSPPIGFNAPRGVAVNNHPASPYFGRVYVANGTAGSKGLGMYAFSSDLSDILGQGSTGKNGGYTFLGGGSSPYHTSVAPDDSVLVTDWTDASGNLISMPPDLSSFTYVLKQIEGPAFAVSPVGSNNNHGSVISAFIVGSGASRKLYTMDEDYQTDPTATAATEWNSTWEYDIGNTSVPWSNAPDRKIMTPYLATFAGQNQKVEVVGHYLYANQRRSNPPQHSAYIVDLNNLQDPSTFTGATPWGMFWTSQGESLAEGYSDDVLRDTMTTSVSPDGKWYATIIAAGSATISAPDGTTFANAANDIILIPLTNGVPNIPARQVFHFGGFGNGRDLAFDDAHNLYCVSSGLGTLQALDIGESTDCTTSSDGTFSMATPPTQVSVAATTPLAYEQGAVPGVITITRTPDNLESPLTVFYTLTGTAKNGTNYVAITNNVTIAAGEASTNVLVTPINDGQPDPTLTAVLTIKGSGGYSVGFPLSATVYIADNSTPQLQIVSLSTNIFEGNTNDYAALHLRRLGDTNVLLTLDASDFTFGGTARPNVDYYVANLPITINPGVVDLTVPLLYPLKASTAVGSLSILVTNLAGSGYTVTNNTAATAITLEATPPGTVLFSDDFETDPTGANWSVAFQSYTNGSTDYSLVFGYDYTSGTLGNLSPIPAAPHSTNGDTKGVYMTVNKNAGISAGLNLYLKNHTFGSNYAFRFDMFLVENSSGSAQSKVENALFGINHDGAHTNWFRNAVTGTSLPASPTASDGLFFDVGADGNGGGGAPYDFAAWSGPTWTNTVNVVGPTNFLARLASTTTNIFKRPPFDSGTAAGGDPANTILNATPSWTEVEVSQVGTPYGNLITWKMNNTVILQFTNNLPNTVGVTNGTVMLGYVDPWDDLGNSSPGSGEGSVIFDNVRVVQLSLPVISPQPTNAMVNIGGSATFTVGATTTTGVTNYQWYSNSVPIANATNASLTVNPTTAGSYSTAYSVLVGDGAYSTWSSTATVEPVSLPSIITPPASRAAVVGSSPSFSVTARTASGITNYQWMYYGTNLPGATAQTFTLTSVQSVSFNGPYTVRVGDGFNFVTSSPPATLTFAVSPTLSSPARSGNNFTLTLNTEVGPKYVLDYKSALTNLTWVPVSTNAGTGGILSITNTSTAPQGYYRIQVQ